MLVPAASLLAIAKPSSLIYGRVERIDNSLYELVFRLGLFYILFYMFHPFMYFGLVFFLLLFLERIIASDFGRATCAPCNSFNKDSVDIFFESVSTLIVFASKKLASFFYFLVRVGTLQFFFFVVHKSRSTSSYYEPEKVFKFWLLRLSVRSLGVGFVGEACL